MDRETLGFILLGSYESYLEESLPESEMHQRLIERFEELNMLYSEFEDFSIIYDFLHTELDGEILYCSDLPVNGLKPCVLSLLFCSDNYL